MKVRKALALIAVLLLAACQPGAPLEPTRETVIEPAPLNPTSPSTTATNTPLPGPTSTPVITSAYLMAFHACDFDTGAECFSPENHMVYLAESNDGRAWSLVPEWQPYSGSVPDVVRRGNYLYVYSAGRDQLLRVDLVQGHAEATPVTIQGLQFGFVDPSPMLDEQGRIVLFFLPGLIGSDPAGCGQEATCTRQILSAVEMEGSDGSEFELIDGARASYEIDANSDLKSFSDPDIFYDGHQYVLYISHGPSTSVWTSDELHGSYTLVDSVPGGLLTFGSGGVPSGHYDALNGEYWTYAHVDLQGKTVIRLAQHADFSTPLGSGDFEIVLSGALLGLGDNVIVASPGFAVNQP